MYIQPISCLTFNSKIKKLFKQGKLKLDYGLYGEPLTKQNVSDEHIICKCYGGQTVESNIALASKEMNNKRGCQPIEKFVTIEMFEKYHENLMNYIGMHDDLMIDGETTCPKCGAIITSDKCDKCKGK